MKLGERLECVYSLVPDGCRFADIGTDHGYLPVKLLLDGIVSCAAASDINEKPLESARQNAEKYGVKDISFFVSDGFDSLDFDFDAAAICGMGGRLICTLLSRCPEVRGKRFILQPMRNDELVREYLWTHGFNIEKELFALEDGKPYAVISCFMDGTKRLFTAKEAYLGLSAEMNEAHEAYDMKLFRRAKNALKGKSENKTAEDLIQTIGDRYGI